MRWISNRDSGHCPSRCSTASAPILDTLTGIGVHTIADVLALPRDGVARRFGQRLLDEIDRARGIQPDPRPLFVPPERYHGQLELPVPVDEAEALLFAAKRLVVELAGFLQGRGAGVTRLRCDLIHEDAPPTAIVQSALHATRKVEHIVNVLRERLAREELPDRVEAIRLVSKKSRRSRGRMASSLPEPIVMARVARSGSSACGHGLARTRCASSVSTPIIVPSMRWRYRERRDRRARRRIPADPPRRPLWLLPRPRAARRRSASAS